MKWANQANPVESTVDVAAAALFAAAVAFAAGATGLGAGATIARATAASLPVYLALRNVAPGERGHAMAAFEPAPLEPAADVGADPGADELLLEDRLGPVTADARVVRLFGPGQEPTRAATGIAPRDDSQALTAALAELRRSLS